MVANGIPMMMSLCAVAMTIAMYISTQEQSIDAVAFLGYTILLELYVGDVFLYLTFEPTLPLHTLVHNQLNSTFLDAVLTLYESVWLLLLPGPESFTAGFISLGSMVILLFADQMLPKHTNTDWRTVWYTVSACRRAFVVGYLTTESLPPMF